LEDLFLSIIAILAKGCNLTTTLGSYGTIYPDTCNMPNLA